MKKLNETILSNGHGVLEMASGTGKTITILSFITSLQASTLKKPKLIYCTRTIQEMEKALKELKQLFKARKENDLDTKLLAIGLSSRKNLCINKKLEICKTSLEYDAKCSTLISDWSKENCEFYPETPNLKEGVYSLEDLVAEGRETKSCPYFMSRRAFEYANIVICSYNYLLDPKISNHLEITNLDKNTIVLFDEAHNIDSVCISSLSIYLNQSSIQNALKNINGIQDVHNQFKKTRQDRLEQEYNDLRSGLQAKEIPGNIRKVDHFLNLLKRFCDFLKSHIHVERVKSEHTTTFMVHFEKETQMKIESLNQLNHRFTSLLNTLELTSFEFLPLKIICEFGTIVSSYKEGFHIVIEPHDERTPTDHDPILSLICLDPSIVMKPLLSHFNTIVITSGTLSPLEMYPKMLNFKPVTSVSFETTMLRRNICPMTVSRGNDQISVTSKFTMRVDPSVVRNYGSLIYEMTSVVPDGILVFFPSYQYMENLIRSWNQMGLLSSICKNKLLFIETVSTEETSKSLTCFKKACDSGRGAIFFCVARGKISEGIDFDGHYGRCVIMIGIPFLNTKSVIYATRLKYMEEKYKIKPEEFELFDAMRQTSQCIGRVIRNKMDYGIMILADKRFNHLDKRKLLPGWIHQHMHESHVNLSIDSALSIGGKFLKEMGQPTKDLTKILLTEQDLNK